MNPPTTERTTAPTRTAPEQCLRVGSLGGGEGRGGEGRGGERRGGAHMSLLRCGPVSELVCMAESAAVTCEESGVCAR